MLRHTFDETHRHKTIICINQAPNKQCFVSALKPSSACQQRLYDNFISFAVKFTVHFKTNEKKAHKIDVPFRSGCFFGQLKFSHCNISLTGIQSFSFPTMNTTCINKPQYDIQHHAGGSNNSTLLAYLWKIIRLPDFNMKLGAVIYTLPCVCIDAILIFYVTSVYIFITFYCYSTAQKSIINYFVLLAMVYFS